MRTRWSRSAYCRKAFCRPHCFLKNILDNAFWSDYNFKYTSTLPGALYISVHNNCSPTFCIFTQPNITVTNATQRNSRNIETNATTQRYNYHTRKRTLLTYWPWPVKQIFYLCMFMFAIKFIRCGDSTNKWLVTFGQKSPLNIFLSILSALVVVFVHLSMEWQFWLTCAVCCKVCYPHLVIAKTTKSIITSSSICPAQMVAIRCHKNDLHRMCNCIWNHNVTAGVGCYYIENPIPGQEHIFSRYGHTCTTC